MREPGARRSVIISASLPANFATFGAARRREGALKFGEFFIAPRFIAGRHGGAGSGDGFGAHGRGGMAPGAADVGEHAVERLVVGSGRRWNLDVRSGRQLHFAGTVAALGVQ